ncbi:hypothetical protein EG329_008561 [Mollisiaceae sp. DMI_Dod_QoI]|nr:hypothetical protein EG329_008561 [Helotiales sp. DMI_Dod_QoI]
MGHVGTDGYMGQDICFGSQQRIAQTRTTHEETHGKAKTREASLDQLHCRMVHYSQEAKNKVRKQLILENYYSAIISKGYCKSIAVKKQRSPAIGLVGEHDAEKPQRHVYVAATAHDDRRPLANIALHVGGKKATGLLDSEAESNLISIDWAKRNGLRHIRKTNPYQMFTIEEKKAQGNKSILFETEPLEVQGLGRSIKVIFDIAPVYKDIVLGTL